MQNFLNKLLCVLRQHGRRREISPLGSVSREHVCAACVLIAGYAPLPLEPIRSETNVLVPGNMPRQRGCGAVFAPIYLRSLRFPLR